LSDHKKTNVYLLTEKGLGLAPTIVELTLWSDKNIREFHAALYRDDRITMLKNNKEGFIHTLQENYKTENWPLQI
jgi:DNA-binding HxlR family transcriptional regulator